MKNKVGEVFHPGPSKTILPNGKESEEKMLSLLRIYCFVQYLISFLVIKKNHFSIFFLLISFSHVITLNLFKSYFMSFHFLHPYHLSNTYKKKIETFFFLSFLHFPFSLFYPTNKVDSLKAPLVGVIIEKMKIRREKNEEKVVSDGVWLRVQKNERKKGLNGKLSI